MHNDLINEYVKEQQVVLKKLWVNDIIGNIKQRLQSKTAATRVTDVNFYTVQMNRTKIKKFEDIVKGLKEERQIYCKNLEGFNIEVRTKPYSGASSLKNHSKRKIAFSDAFSCYEDPYMFLQKLKEICYIY